jgi:hypothetical protein
VEAFKFKQMVHVSHGDTLIYHVVPCEIDTDDSGQLEMHLGEGLFRSRIEFTEGQTDQIRHLLLKDQTAPTPDPSMSEENHTEEKWEYRYHIFGPTEFVPVCNSLGEKGWEMVNAVYTQDDDHICHFKRRKA